MLTVKNVLYLLLICLLIHCARSASTRINAKKTTQPDEIDEIDESVTEACARESECKVNENTIPLCRYDDAEGCIRKYASKCHLDIAACEADTEYTDYSNDYCSMETYLCEEGYERWTIFFGYEKV